MTQPDKFEKKSSNGSGFFKTNSNKESKEDKQKRKVEERLSEFNQLKAQAKSAENGSNSKKALELYLKASEKLNNDYEVIHKIIVLAFHQKKFTFGRLSSIKLNEYEAHLIGLFSTSDGRNSVNNLPIAIFKDEVILKALINAFAKKEKDAEYKALCARIFSSEDIQLIYNFVFNQTVFKTLSNNIVVECLLRFTETQLTKVLQDKNRGKAVKKRLKQALDDHGQVDELKHQYGKEVILFLENLAKGKITPSKMDEKSSDIDESEPTVYEENGTICVNTNNSNTPEKVSVTASLTKSLPTTPQNKTPSVAKVLPKAPVQKQPTVNNNNSPKVETYTNIVTQVVNLPADTSPSEETSNPTFPEMKQPNTSTSISTNAHPARGGPRGGPAKSLGGKTTTATKEGANEKVAVPKPKPQPSSGGLSFLEELNRKNAERERLRKESESTVTSSDIENKVNENMQKTKSVPVNDNSLFSVLNASLDKHRFHLNGDNDKNESDEEWSDDEENSYKNKIV